MKKALITFGIIIIIIISYLFWYYTSSSDDEIHLLPKNFKGIVIIRFNVKNGKDELYENGKRVYEIPQNGILDTKFGFDEGWSSPPEIYYLDGDKRISLGNNKVFSMRSGVAISDITNKEISFSTYLVCEEKEQDSLFNIRERLNVADAK